MLGSPLAFLQQVFMNKKWNLASGLFFHKMIHTEGTDAALFILTIKWETASRVSNNIASLIPNCATKEKLLISWEFLKEK